MPRSSGPGGSSHLLLKLRSSSDALTLDQPPTSGHSHQAWSAARSTVLNKTTGLHPGRDKGSWHAQALRPGRHIPASLVLRRVARVVGHLEGVEGKLARGSTEEPPGHP